MGVRYDALQPPASQMSGYTPPVATAAPGVGFGVPFGAASGYSQQPGMGPPTSQQHQQHLSPPAPMTYMQRAHMQHTAPPYGHSSPSTSPQTRTRSSVVGPTHPARPAARGLSNAVLVAVGGENDAQTQLRRCAHMCVRTTHTHTHTRTHARTHTHTHTHTRMHARTHARTLVFFYRCHCLPCALQALMPC